MLGLAGGCWGLLKALLGLTESKNHLNLCNFAHVGGGCWDAVGPDCAYSKGSDHSSAANVKINVFIRFCMQRGFLQDPRLF